MCTVQSRSQRRSWFRSIFRKALPSFLNPSHFVNLLSPGHILSILVLTRVPGRKYVLILSHCTSNNGKVGFVYQNGRVVQLRFSRKRFLGELVLVGAGVGAAAGAPGASERRRQAGGHLHHLHQSNHQSNQQNLTGELVTPQPSR